VLGGLNLGNYIAKRLMQAVPILLLVSFIIFITIRAAPGDPVMMRLGPYGERTPEMIEAVEKQMGLDQPIIIQYFYWLRDVLRGDLGVSLRSGRPVLNIVIERIPASLQLISFSVFFALLIGIPTGVLCAINKGGIIDQIATTISMGFLAIPSFWFGLLLILFFSINLRVLPASGYVSFFESPYWNLTLIIMPVLSLGAFELANFLRFVRSDMIEVLSEDYIRTARSKGLYKTAIYFKHAFKNVMLTLITVVGMELGVLLGGTVIVEQLFGWPGVGWLIFQSIINRDYPVVQGAVLFVVVSFVLINTLVDILYAVIDPRIKLDKGVK